MEDGREVKKLLLEILKGQHMLCIWGGAIGKILSVIIWKIEKILQNVVNQIKNVSQLLKLAPSTWAILIEEEDDSEGRVMPPRATENHS